MLNISDDNDLAEIIQKCMINEYVRYEIHYICSIISKLVMESKINFKWEPMIQQIYLRSECIYSFIVHFMTRTRKWEFQSYVKIYTDIRECREKNKHNYVRNIWLVCGIIKPITQIFLWSWRLHEYNTNHIY